MTLETAVAEALLTRGVPETFGDALVEKISAVVPVTREYLEDAPTTRAFLEELVRFAHLAALGFVGLVRCVRCNRAVRCVYSVRVAWSPEPSPAGRTCARYFAEVGGLVVDA